MTWRRVYIALRAAFLTTWLLGAFLESVALLKAMAIIAFVAMTVIPMHALVIGITGVIDVYRSRRRTSA